VYLDEISRKLNFIFYFDENAVFVGVDGSWTGKRSSNVPQNPNEPLSVRVLRQTYLSIYTYLPERTDAALLEARPGPGGIFESDLICLLI